MKNESDQAREWLEVFEAAKQETKLLFQCAVWAQRSLITIENKLSPPDNIHPISDDVVLKSTAIYPYPDPRMRTFEEIGRSLDDLFHKVNILLPEPWTKK